ncbi:MAG: hypothetical protein JNM93_02275 [Bacteriovoracaceae bacterium]|nr:hypothetical protein [Bacteriovoracaceae bacterium]
MKASFEKYKYYEQSVQSPENEIEFLVGEYQRLNKRKPTSLREDFGGTGYLCCEWVKASNKNTAYAVDLDLVPLKWGMKHHYAKLTSEQQKRMTFVNSNVLTFNRPRVDIVCALNFSYFIFKERDLLVEYFKKVKNSLSKDGVFFIDLFGGTLSQTVMEEKVKHKGFTYYWECQKFNPINNHCFFAIHFKLNSGKFHRNVFTYDWRLWSAPELMDMLREAGFTQTNVLWEGDDDKGGGNGIFKPTKKAENCESWIAYIAAQP